MTTHHDIVKEELGKFLETHRPIKSSLEVGCGSDPFDEFMQNNWNIRAISMDKDVCKIPHKDDSFDLVFGCHCFEHFERLVDALREVYRVLHKGGYVWFATPYPCASQTLDFGADQDHLFCLHPMQWLKLLRFTKFVEQDSYIKRFFNGNEIYEEHNWNVISWGRK